MCRILAIETSCDETAAAVIEDGQTILSNVISSQSDIHKRFGGVVPEVASRKHVEQITMVIEQALVEANTKKEELSAIAVTQGPGLVGALLIGIMAAKALAFSLRLPLIAVHHIAGHIYANQLVEPLTYPSMALVVSGGHTELIRMPGEGQFERIGQTRDDAVGEAYDKVARTLGLSYPGGPPIDKLAQTADRAIELPRAWLEPDSFDFSFSGLKSAVMNVVNQAKMKGNPLDQAEVAKGFQDSIVEVLVEKSIRAVRTYDMNELVLAGGVAANRGLRDALEKRCAQEGIHLRIPPLHLCTDNAAMIGAAAYIKWKKKDFASLDVQARPSYSLAEWQKTAAGS